MDIITLFKTIPKNLKLYIKLVNKVAEINYDKLNTLTKKILYNKDKKENTYFWDTITDKYNKSNNIEEIQEFVYYIYNIYLRCPDNEYLNLKPLDNDTNLPIEYDNIYKDETNGFCYDDLTYIKTIIIDGNTSIIPSNNLAEASINIGKKIISDSTLTIEDKEEQLEKLSDNIGEKAGFKFSWQKGALLLGFLALLTVGIPILHNVNTNINKINLYKKTINSNITIVDYGLYKSINVNHLNLFFINPESFSEMYQYNNNALLILYKENSNNPIFKLNNIKSGNDLITYVDWFTKYNYIITKEPFYLLNHFITDEDLKIYYDFNKNNVDFLEFDKFKIYIKSLKYELYPNTQHIPKENPRYIEYEKYMDKLYGNDINENKILDYVKQKIFYNKNPPKPNATKKLIKRVLGKLGLIYHPDKDIKSSNSEITIIINNIRDELFGK